MIRDIEEINLPEYATLRTATVTMQNMGDQTIEATLSIDSGITPDFSEDWIIKFRGVEFVHPLRTPQASKANDKFNPEYPLTFYHKGIYDLKRKFFFSLPPVESSTAVPDKYEASLALNVVDFVDAYSKVLAYHYGDYITIDLNPEPEKPYDKETTAIAISYTKMWDLLSAFYNNYAVSWWIEPKAPSGYVIKVGYNRLKLSHQFAYGFEGGLLKMERQVQSSDIINILLGRGGTKNLPYRYFKDRAVDSGGGGDEATFDPDPDWIPELAMIPFDGLRDINFRYWVQGWKDKGGGRRYTEGEHWSYDMGYSATTFDPVEYVRDLASIAKYGELWGGLQKIEDIYPSIQGVFRPNLGRVDQLVDVQQIDEDFESSQASIPEVTTKDVDGFEATVYFTDGQGTKNFEATSETTFTVDEGYEANVYLSYRIEAISGGGSSGTHGSTTDVSNYVQLGGEGTYIVKAVNTATGEETAPVNLSAGTYRLKVSGSLTNSYPSGKPTAHFILHDVQVKETILSETRANLNSFSIWVKNIWETTKLDSETETAYARRVWEPILGDYLGTEAKVIFSSGYLSISEDYEFMLVGNKLPEYDTSKSINCKDENGNTINVPSHWKITLQRSDAEYDTTGKYLPNEEINAEAGQYFFFIGIDMPHQYVVWAEQRLNAYKLQQLDDVSEINPTWAIELSKIRINSPHGEETESLISQLGVGSDVQLYSKWFISDPSNIGEGETYTTTIQTLTFKYEEPKKDSPGLLPSVSITLADKPMTTASSVSLLQGSVDALTSRINSMSAPYVIDVIKSADKVTTPTDYNVYSAKKAKRITLSSETDDEADGHITFNQGLTSNAPAKLTQKTQFGRSFISGPTGIGGQIDAQAHAEFDSLTLRSWLEVPEIRFNRTSVLLGDQWQAPGGGIVESVAIDTDDNNNLLRTGTITLKLEQGEIGAIAVDDICKGYFHDFAATGNNATADVDDSKGNTMFSGFCTVFFRITEILDSDGVNKKFRYMLRKADGTDGDWNFLFHPYEAMHFVSFGNFTDVTRQRSAYQTRTYTRYLIGVDDWEFDASNIAMQFGNLDNLQAFGINMTGYSAYLQNIYFSGTIQHIEVDAPYELQITTNTSDFFIAENETLTITCAVKKAWEDKTADVTKWSITRDSGDDAADAIWNAAHQMTSASITLTAADIGATTLNANSLFEITATGNGWTASKTVAVRTLRFSTTLSMRFESEYGINDTFVSYGDTVRFQAVIEDGLRNAYTDEYDNWSIVRHNGDTADDIASDGVWNATRAAISSEGAFSIEWSAQHDDLQAERATFIVTATKSGASPSAITGTLSI